MRAFIITILFGSLMTLCYSQTGVVSYNTSNAYLEKGDYYFGKKNYKKAIVYFNMALKMDGSYYSVLRKAEAYEALNLYDQAVECYRILFQTNYEVPNEFYLRYAFLLLKKNDIKSYEIWLTRYKENVQSEMKNKSAKKISAEMYKDSTIVIVENESVLNTPESEINPVVFNNIVCFASTRKNLIGSKGNDFYNLFAANYVKGGKLGKLNVFNKSIDSKQNEVSVSFSGKTNKIYITRSSQVGQDIKSYDAKIPVNNNEKLALNDFNLQGFAGIGQISFNNDGSKMYFVSEAIDGSGGFDIYSTELINGKWSSPKNLGKQINTGQDEIYPCVVNDSILYFSSNGHKGLGGFDLFSVNLNKENSTPKNLGNKVNSKFDDYGLSFTPGGLTGYFCSNRPGGFGKEDIYRLHLLDLKVKKPAFQFKKTPSIEDKKINLYLSDGTDYNITSDNIGFSFGFQPQESYKMVIQHENPLASNIIKDPNLTETERAKAFLIPEPFEKTEIELEPGMKYQFAVGMKPISDDYKKALREMSKDYQNEKSSTIDLTALAKELLLKDGEVYTLNFVKVEGDQANKETENVTQLFVNKKTVDVSGRSFLVVLPLDIETSFNVRTDLDHFKETFNPKKTGTVKVDTDPVIKEKPVKLTKGFPILVNTQTIGDDYDVISARELSIIPGSFYQFSLIKSFPGTDQKLEIFVPLTKGVKYNIGKGTPSGNAEFKKELSQMKSGKGSGSDEELIDISILKKELDISPDDSILFSLTPVKSPGSKSSEALNVVTILDIDGVNYMLQNNQKLNVHLMFEQDIKVNIQTDLGYVKENFEPSTIALNVDDSAMSKNVEVEMKKIITDPVFDVVVINFNINEYSIRPDAKKILDDKVINVLGGDNRIYVTIKGYTDPLGDADYNERLSKNRAQTVKDYLTNNGIGENRIRTFSFGETLSLKDDESWEELSEEELQKHRKVEIVMYLPK